MPDIKFYQLNGTCANAAHALFKELDIPFTRIEMGRSDSGFQAKDGSFTNEWYKKNVSHMGYVPALVVDGKTLTENPAVLTYIASLKPERKMLGSDDWEKAKVLEWMAWLSGTTHGAGVAGFLRPYRFTDDEAAFPGIKKKAMEKIMGSLDTIEANVEDSGYAVGNTATIADFFLHVIWRWAGVLKVDREKYPRFRAVAKNIENLPGGGMKSALKDEELPLEFPEGAKV